MVNRILAAAVCAAVLLPLASSQADAFGQRGCGKAVACYKRVRSPDVYGTQVRPVTVRPGYRSVHITPPVLGFRPQLITRIPAHLETYRSPAAYGMRVKQVLVRPGRTVWRTQRAVYRTVRRKVVVGGGYKWVKKRDRHGVLRMCKVIVRASTRIVTKRILVSPGRRVAYRTAPVYRSVRQRIRLREASVKHVYQPAVHQWVKNPITVAPAQRHVVSHPPVVQMQRYKVLVRRGGHRWVRDDGRW